MGWGGVGCDNVHVTCVGGVSCYASVMSLVLVKHTTCYASVMSLVLVKYTRHATLV